MTTLDITWVRRSVDPNRRRKASILFSLILLSCPKLLASDRLVPIMCSSKNEDVEGGSRRYEINGDGKSGFKLQQTISPGRFKNRQVIRPLENVSVKASVTGDKCELTVTDLREKRKPGFVFHISLNQSSETSQGAHYATHVERTRGGEPLLDWLKTSSCTIDKDFAEKLGARQCGVPETMSLPADVPPPSSNMK